MQAQSSSDFAVQRIRTKAFYALGQFEAAHAAATQTVCVSANGQETLSAALWQTGNSAESAALAAHLEQIAPEAPETLIAAGNALALSGDRSTAIECFESASENATRLDRLELSSYAQLLCANEHLSLDKLSEAENHFRTALEHLPGSYRALFGLASIAEQQGRLNEASRLLQRTLRANPRCVDAHVQLALLCRQSHQEAMALQSLQKALTVSPAHPHALYELAALQLHRGRYDQALLHASALSRVAPEDSDAITLQARILAKLGRNREAASLFARALALQPPDAAVVAQELQQLHELISPRNSDVGDEEMLPMLPSAPSSFFSNA
ncbi:MAG: hypothetical protein MHM6MM_004201 [Cercozoa sp. M6MM]